MAASRCFIFMCFLLPRRVPDTDQHKGGIVVRKTPHCTCTATYLPFQPFNDIVSADTSPVFAGKIAIGKRLLNAVFHLLSRLFQLHSTQFFYHRFGLLTGGFLALLGVDRLEHLGYQLHLRARCYREHIAVKVTVHRWYLASGNTSPTASSIPRHLSPTMSFMPSRPRPHSH